LCKNFSKMCVYDDRNSVFRGKNYYLLCKIWRFGGIMGTGGSKYVVKSAIFGIADPDLPIRYATFMGLQ